ncbi:mRNA-capping enzyme subunit beta [Mortierella sp. GBA30]|nr:mRNA-capping enzyme subunit beta [Mortierella sp. GBA30]
MSDQDKKRPLEDDEKEQIQSLTGASAGMDGQPSKKARSENADSLECTLVPAILAVTTTHPTEAGTLSQGASTNGERPIAQPVQQQRVSQQQHPGAPLQQHRSPRRDHAFFGTDVLDDVVRAIGEFLFEHCHHANVEIEAKLGVLIDKNTGRRIELPVRNEAVLTSQGRPAWYKFSSDMTLERHERYQHTYEIDQFFTSANGKTRVTKDQKTNAVIPNGIVQKDRIADLDVFSPKNPFDFRISVNIEVPVGLPQGVPQFERRKDRVSYRHNNFKIDLTQVKTANAPSANQNAHNYSQMRPQPNSNPLDVTHELEIEFVNPEELVREREVRINSGGMQPDRFMDIVGHFVNNVRGLVVRGNIQRHPQQQHQQRLNHHPQHHQPTYAQHHQPPRQ